MDNCSDLRISNCSAATLDLWLLTFVILTSVIVSLHYCLLKGTVCKIPPLDVSLLEIAVNLILCFLPLTIQVHNPSYGGHSRTNRQIVGCQSTVYRSCQYS